jgi:hypothetical protein
MQHRWHWYAFDLSGCVAYQWDHPAGRSQANERAAMIRPLQHNQGQSALIIPDHPHLSRLPEEDEMWAMGNFDA